MYAHSALWNTCTSIDHKLKTTKSSLNMYITASVKTYMEIAKEKDTQQTQDKPLPFQNASYNEQNDHR